MRLKSCARCKTKKEASLANFVPNKECVGGIGPYCRPCSRIKAAEWRDKNRDRRRARRRELYHIRTAPIEAAKRVDRILRKPVTMSAARLLSGVNDRCKERSLPRAHELKKRSFFEDWLTKQPNCACCGIEFNLGPKGGIKSDASPSIDQIVPGLGYELTNVALICWRCNNIKRNYTSSDLRLVANWIDTVSKTGK